MNVILYTNDFEPINVIDLPRWLLDRAEQRGFVKISVPSKTTQETFTLIVQCKKLAWHDGTIKSFLTVDNEVLALALHPTWLPGQTQAIQSTNRLLSRLHSKVIELMRKN